MAQTRKPNTICKNPNCTKGADGGRKHFYACMSCLRNENWKAYCCSFECYEEYIRIVLADRAKSHENMLPDRTDMTQEEILNVMKQPVEDVEEYTKSVELADYTEENPNEPLSDILQKVNEDIDKGAKARKKKRKP